MSEDMIKRILKTYPPVEGKPDYVWFSKSNCQIIKLSILREAYEEHFNSKAGEIGGKVHENNDTFKQ